MPLYDFVDTESGEAFELLLKIAEREEFLEANPNLRQLVGAPMIVSGVDGLRKVDDGFSEVLQKIGEQNPQSNFGRSMNSAKSGKQGQVNKAVDRWKAQADKDKKVYDTKGLEDLL
ncbi:MAG: hypothetical protein ACKVJK_14780 [Methylophagaceae bacterium]|jgi:hypothetical protein|tara:strand:- start:386 stop:733 length:348 start_codon:yes stop_codon:yes gene_type:complete